MNIGSLITFLKRRLVVSGNWKITNHCVSLPLFYLWQDCASDDLDINTTILMVVDNIKNNKKRKSLYKYYFDDKYGCLGRGNRKRIDNRVVAYIVIHFLLRVPWHRIDGIPSQVNVWFYLTSNYKLVSLLWHVKNIAHI